MTAKRKPDRLLAAGLRLLAGILYWSLRPGGSGAWVVVTVDGTETARCALSEEQTVTIGDMDYNVLVIHHGTAEIVESNCGDHTCVRTGTISREGETIVCLPHRLVVRIEGGEASPFDAEVR